MKQYLPACFLVSFFCLLSSFGSNAYAQIESVACENFSLEYSYGDCIEENGEIVLVFDIVGEPLKPYHLVGTGVAGISVFDGDTINLLFADGTQNVFLELQDPEDDSCVSTWFSGGTLTCTLGAPHLELNGINCDDVLPQFSFDLELFVNWEDEWEIIGYGNDTLSFTADTLLSLTYNDGDLVDLTFNLNQEFYSEYQSTNGECISAACSDLEIVNTQFLCDNETNEITLIWELIGDPSALYQVIGTGVQYFMYGQTTFSQTYENGTAVLITAFPVVDSGCNAQWDSLGPLTCISEPDNNPQINLIEQSCDPVLGLTTYTLEITDIEIVEFDVFQNDSLVYANIGLNEVFEVVYGYGETSQLELIPADDPSAFYGTFWYPPDPLACFGCDALSIELIDFDCYESDSLAHLLFEFTGESSVQYLLDLPDAGDIPVFGNTIFELTFSNGQLPIFEIRHPELEDCRAEFIMDEAINSNLDVIGPRLELLEQTCLSGTGKVLLSFFVYGNENYLISASGYDPFISVPNDTLSFLFQSGQEVNVSARIQGVESSMYSCSSDFYNSGGPLDCDAYCGLEGIEFLSSETSDNGNHTTFTYILNADCCDDYVLNIIGYGQVEVQENQEFSIILPDTLAPSLIAYPVGGFSCAAQWQPPDLECSGLELELELIDFCFNENEGYFALGFFVHGNPDLTYAVTGTGIGAPFEIPGNTEFTMAYSDGTAVDLELIDPDLPNCSSSWTSDGPVPVVQLGFPDLDLLDQSCDTSGEMVSLTFSVYGNFQESYLLTDSVGLVKEIPSEGNFTLNYPLGTEVNLNIILNDPLYANCDIASWSSNGQLGCFECTLEEFTITNEECLPLDNQMVLSFEINASSMDTFLIAGDGIESFEVAGDQAFDLTFEIGEPAIISASSVLEETCHVEIDLAVEVECLPSGLSGNANNGLQIFPSVLPEGSVLTIRKPTSCQDPNTALKVFDIWGRSFELLAQESADNLYRFSTKGLEAGEYVVSLLCADSSFNAKFIVF